MTVHVLDIVRADGRKDVEETTVRLRVRLEADWRRLFSGTGFSGVEFYGNWSGAAYTAERLVRLDPLADAVVGASDDWIAPRVARETERTRGRARLGRPSRGCHCRTTHCSIQLPAVATPRYCAGAAREIRGHDRKRGEPRIRFDSEPPSFVEAPDAVLRLCSTVGDGFAATQANLWKVRERLI